MARHLALVYEEKALPIGKDPPTILQELCIVLLVEKYASLKLIMDSRSRPRVNGATPTTFRRPSLATNLSHQRESSQTNSSSTNQNSGVYVPPHMNSTYQSRGGPSETRYSRDQLLDFYRARSTAGPSSTNISDLCMDGWNPTLMNGMTNGGWSRKDELKDGPPAPEICWNHDGNVRPLGLIDLTEEEQAVRTIFSLQVCVIELIMLAGVLELSQLPHQSPYPDGQQGFHTQFCSARQTDFRY